MVRFELFRPVLVVYDLGCLAERVHKYYCYGIRSQNHIRNGLIFGPHSIMVVYMDPLGYYFYAYLCYRIAKPLS